MDFQLTGNEDQTGIYYAAHKPRSLREGRKVKRRNHSEEATPELKIKNQKKEKTKTRVFDLQETMECMEFMAEAIQ